MDQQLRLLEPTEPITEEEVRALLQRFGENQTLDHLQPTIRDVAEVLQVESSTIGSMLVELRRSYGQSDVRERLNRLEEENAKLRRGAEAVSMNEGPTFKNHRVNTVRTALFAALSLLIVLTAVSGLSGERQWWLGVVPIVFALIALSGIRRT